MCGLDKDTRTCAGELGAVKIFGLLPYSSYLILPNDTSGSSRCFP